MSGFVAGRAEVDRVQYLLEQGCEKALVLRDLERWKGIASDVRLGLIEIIKRVGSGKEASAQIKGYMERAAAIGRPEASGDIQDLHELFKIKELMTIVLSYFSRLNLRKVARALGYSHLAASARLLTKRDTDERATRNEPTKLRLRIKSPEEVEPAVAQIREAEGVHDLSVSLDYDDPKQEVRGIVETITSCRTLKKLYLGRYLAPAFGLASLATCLGNNRNLTLFRTSGNLGVQKVNEIDRLGPRLGQLREWDACLATSTQSDALERALIKYLPNLRTLGVTNNLSLTAAFFKEVALHCPRLSTLNIVGSDNLCTEQSFNHLRGLPNLNFLRLHGWGHSWEVRNGSFVDWLPRYASLKRLELMSPKPLPTEIYPHFVRLGRSYPGLDILSLRNIDYDHGRWQIGHETSFETFYFLKALLPLSDEKAFVQVWNEVWRANSTYAGLLQDRYRLTYEQLTKMSESEREVAVHSAQADTLLEAIVEAMETSHHAAANKYRAVLEEHEPRTRGELLKLSNIKAYLAGHRKPINAPAKGSATTALSSS
jgi:hypothetical protein